METEMENAVSETTQHVTARELASLCGCTKPTVVKIAKELDPDCRHRHKEGNTVMYDQWLASAIADEVPRHKEGKRGAGNPAKRLEARDGELDAVRDALARERELHGEAVAQYEARISQYEARVVELSAEAERERERAAEATAQVERLQAELSLSMALEGFHFPWQRASIIRRYALPESTD